MKVAFLLLVFSMLVASAISSSIIPPLVCPLTHHQKRMFIDCLRPNFTSAFKRQLREFLRCSGLPHFINFLELSCDYTPSDTRVSHVTNCLHRYPGIKDLPGGDEAIQICARRAHFY